MQTENVIRASSIIQRVLLTTVPPNLVANGTGICADLTAHRRMHIFPLIKETHSAQWISFPWHCAVPRPVYKKRWHGPNLQRAGSHCDAGGCRWGQQRCWKECIRVPYYSAQSGKPAGVKTLWSYTSKEGELEQACICSRTHCVISLIKSLTGGVPVVWPLWAWWSFRCLEAQIAHKEWADTLLPGSFSLPLSEEGSAPG